MAAVDRLSILLGSDACLDTLCAICFKQDKYVAAARYCDGCHDNLCSTCLQWHDKFSATKDHRKTEVLARSQTLPKKLSSSQKEGSPILRRRPQSENQRFKDAPPPLPTRPSNLYTPIIQRCERLQESKREKIIQINTEENTNVFAIQTIRDNVIKHIDKLAMATIDQVREAYESEREKEIKDLEYLGTHTRLMREEKNVDIDKEREVLDKLEQNERKRLRFVAMSEIDAMFKKTTGIGVLSTEGGRQGSARRRGSYKVALEDDRKECVLYASCLIADGTVVFTDNANKSLKILNRKSNSFERFCLPSGPWGVCSTNLYEVAVTLTNAKTVQFVTIGATLSMTSSFKVNEHCRGICHSDSKLYIACGSENYAGTGFIGVYTMSGQSLHTINTDCTGKPIFSLPYHVIKQPGNDKLYVADKNRGVIIVSDQGVLNTPCMELVKTIYLCAHDNGEFFACGLNSDTVVHFDKNGKKIRTLLCQENGLDGPYSVLFDHADSTLIVTSCKKGVVDVFSVN